MSTAFVHGLPILLVIALIALVYRRGRNDRPTYRLPQPFTHDPILWTATEEVVPDGDAHGHGASDLNVGGGVSGRW